MELFDRLGVGKKGKDAEHLVPLQLAYKHGHSYFLVFPWADGNLKEFWKNVPAEPSSPDCAVWLFRQCYGIARGLRKIHHLGTIPTGNLDDELPEIFAYDNKQWGRHGDIKPENILWFENYDEHRDFLVISDFGLTQFNSADSRSKVPQETVPGATGTYKAPELDLDEDISPRYDIWSLGCVFLEFLSWFLLGNDQTEDDFARARLDDEKRHNSVYASDRFYGLIQSATNPQVNVDAEVKQSVVEVSGRFQSIRGVR